MFTRSLTTSCNSARLEARCRDASPGPCRFGTRMTGRFAGVENTLSACTWASSPSLPTSHLRIARPSHDLRASERFWVDGLGLDVLFRADDSADGGHALLMVGWPGAVWHLELVGVIPDSCHFMGWQ